MDDRRIYERARRQIERMKLFYIHATMYTLVNAALFVIDMLTPGGPWFYWPVLVWGAAVLAHGFSVYGIVGLWGPDWEERKIAEFIKREQGAKQ
jgi:hypothetical protein